MKAKWLAVLFVLLCCLTVPFFACDDDDDNDDDNVDDDDDDDDYVDDDDTEGDDDTGDDDTSVDDDTSDDDTGDDDSIDDDTDVDHAPVITEYYCDPDPPIYSEVEGYGMVWHTNETFYLCDEDNDLLPDGNLVHDIEQPFEDVFYPLTIFHDPPETDLANAGDCTQPVKIFLIFYTPEEPPSGEHCADFYVEDSAGNRSEKVSLCFTMP